MNFICSPCKAAADIRPSHPTSALNDIKANLHTRCKGYTWCDCQHRTGKTT